MKTPLAAKMIRPLAYDSPAKTWSELPFEKKRILETVGRGKRVLEVGCSTGNFTRHLQEQGCHVTGIELDSEAADKARAYAKRVIVGDVEDHRVWSELSEKFDYILFMHVLEHVVDPWRILREARTYLELGGSALILLPNVACWEIRRQLFFKGVFQYRDFGILDISHLRFFTLGSAVDLIQRAGYRVETWETVGSTVPFAGKMKKVPGVRRLAPSWERFMIRRFPNFCGAVFFFEAVASS